LLIHLRQYVSVVSLWLVALSLVVSPSSAQTRGTLKFTLSEGVYHPPAAFQAGCYVGPCLRTSHAVAYGAGVTGWVGKRVAVEGSLRYSPSTGIDDLLVGDIRLLVGLVHAGRTLWYVGGGPAYVSHANGGVHGVFGGGVEVGVFSRVAIRAEFEDYVSSRRHSVIQDRFLSLGASITVRAGALPRAQTR
jgi:hypothetical protein